MAATKEPAPDSRDAPPIVALGDSGGLSWSFAGFRLEADGTLRRGEAVVHLPPKELVALQLLLTHSGQVISPLQLKQKLWGDVHVTADSVPKCLSSLRARLAPEMCIQTIYKRGYRLTGEVKSFGMAPIKRPLRLAILPFATRAFVPEHLGAAIAEETIATLARSSQQAVAVLARDSIFTLVQRGLTAQDVGKELKADLVLTGILQAFSSHYRLRAEMIRVEDGTQIWIEDVLASQSQTGGLESELMRRLAYRLDMDLSIDGSKSSSLDIAAAASGDREEAEPRQAEAYEIFLRGHHEWQTLHRHRMQDGLQHLLRAVELDPTLVAAKIDLAHLCVTQAFYGFMSPTASAELVHRVADSVPDLAHRADALLPALGWVNFHYDRNLPAALLAYSLSAHLPHDPWTTRARVMFALSSNRIGEAISMLRAAIQMDPFSPWLQNRLAWALHLDGQAAESVAQVRSSMSLFPRHEGTGLYGAMILAFNGEVESAVELARELERRQPHLDLATAVHAYALACAGRTDEARVILERLEWLGRERYIVRAYTPAAYVALEDYEAALAELRFVDEARCPLFFQTLADPRLKPLHDDLDFQRMQAIFPAMQAEVEPDLELVD